MARHIPKTKKGRNWISNKIRTIMHEGIRRKKVSIGQATAVAFSMWRARKKKK